MYLHKFLLLHVYPLLFYSRKKISTHRGSYISAHVLLNLLNELAQKYKMRGLQSILSLFHNEFDKYDKTRTCMLDSIYHMTLVLL